MTTASQPNGTNPLISLPSKRFFFLNMRRKRKKGERKAAASVSNWSAWTWLDTWLTQPERKHSDLARVFDDVWHNWDTDSLFPCGGGKKGETEWGSRKCWCLNCVSLWMFILAFLNPSSTGSFSVAYLQISNLWMPAPGDSLSWLCI